MANKGPHIYVPKQFEHGAMVRDVTPHNVTRAWGMPKWYRRGEAGVAQSSFDIYADDMRQNYSNGRKRMWEVFFGLHVNRKSNMNQDKSEVALFVQHANGRWAPAIYCKQAFLLMGNDSVWNHKDYGCRWDEYINTAISMCGLQNNASERRILYLVLDKTLAAAKIAMFNPSIKAQVKDAIEIAMRKKWGLKWADYEPNVDRRTGKPDGSYYAEGFDGSMQGTTEIVVGDEARALSKEAEKMARH